MQNGSGALEGVYGVHRIALRRNAFARTVELVVDDVVVASARRLWPRDVVLRATLELDGGLHEVVAHETVQPVFGMPARSTSGIDIDGVPLRLTVRG
jgi:hypothetical protein